MKDKGLFFWKESVVNGKSYYQLWFRGNPDRFICSERNLVKTLEGAGFVLEQTKKIVEITTNPDTMNNEVSD